MTSAIFSHFWTPSFHVIVPFTQPMVPYDICTEGEEGVGQFLTKGREVAWIRY